MLTRLYAGFFFFRRSGAAYSEVSGGILPKFALIQVFMVVLVTCKHEDPINKEGSRVLTRFSPYKSMGFFSNAEGQLTPVNGGILQNFVLIQAFMVVLVTCKNEKDPIKNEGSRVLKRFSAFLVYGNFFKHSTAAYSAGCGQIRLKFILVLSCLPARMKKIRSKTEGARVL